MTFVVYINHLERVVFFIANRAVDSFKTFQLAIRAISSLWTYYVAAINALEKSRHSNLPLDLQSKEADLVELCVLVLLRWEYFTRYYLRITLLMPHFALSGEQ